jgi:cytidyltransferase-like protein
MNAQKIGFTIGKFAPFHKGHEYLINTALQEMDEFYIVVYDTPQFNISMQTKLDVLKQKYPKVQLIEAYNSPKQIGLDGESVEIQMKYLSNLIKDINPTHFFSSENYGECVAKYLKIENRVVDKERIKYPISATMIRNGEYKELKEELK